MTTTKQIRWRLKEQPTTESLRELVKDKLLTSDEAREILFGYMSEEPAPSQDIDSLKAEIKFLRELVDTLSKNQATRVIEYIERYPAPYRQLWFQPYQIYCSTSHADVTDGTVLDATNLASLN